MLINAAKFWFIRYISYFSQLYLMLVISNKIKCCEISINNSWKIAGQMIQQFLRNFLSCFSQSGTVMSLDSNIGFEMKNFPINHLYIIPAKLKNSYGSVILKQRVFCKPTINNLFCSLSLLAINSTYHKDAGSRD